MSNRILIRFGAAALLLALAGCASAPQLDQKKLARIYQEYREAPKKNPVIFIPGVMGSVLQDKSTGEIVFGRVGKVFLNVLALPITAPLAATQLITNQDNIVATTPLYKVSLVPGVIEKNVYDTVRQGAVTIGGYTLGKDASAFAYDWRRCFAEAASQLDALIKNLQSQSGNPDTKVILVCHSAGGLVARYYLRYGAEDVLHRDQLPTPTYAGAANVFKVIMLGTPNAGAMSAFMSLHRGEMTGVGVFRPETVFTMPSVYQMLPPEGEPMFVDAAGKPLDVNLYDPANWEKYGWSVFDAKYQASLKNQFLRKHGVTDGPAAYEENLNCQRRFLAEVLACTKRFHQAIWQGDPAEERKHITYILTGADAQPTVSRAMLVPKDSGWETRFDASGDLKDAVFSYGDGTVTRESLLGLRRGPADNIMRRLPDFYEVFIAGSHMDLPTNPTYMDNVLDMLLD